ncbi:CUB and sushi domain-containing protein 1 [Mactra antiquata]
MPVGQLSEKEVLRNYTECQLDNVVIQCDTDTVIAIQSLDIRYRDGCDDINCCSYNETDNSATTHYYRNDVLYTRRTCSGRTDCSINLHRVVEFGTKGPQIPSYVIIEYYCIPDSRTTDICSDSSLESINTPLYLTNTNYPGKTTGSGTCTCSLEVLSCTSDILLYVIDMDLYLNNNESCYQTMAINDRENTTVQSYDCGDYYINDITTGTIPSHYTSINYTDFTPGLDYEGYFFIGFTDCDEVTNITNGYISLDEPNITKYNSSATVTCTPGYDAAYDTIFCLESGLWENSSCIIKDCGEVMNITNGNIILDFNDVTTYNSTASVNCLPGYEATNETVTCLDSGMWENATCDIKDCGEPNITNGNVNLGFDNITTYGATASVTCDTGYKATNETIVCLHSGIWDNTSCVLIDCGDVADINFGNITLNEANTTTFLDNATATVTCNIGYQATNENISCQADAAWEVTFCEIIDCGNVTDIDFGNITLNEANTTTYLDNAKATVTCDIGHQATNENISCQGDGTWEDTSCEIIGTKTLNCMPFLTK